MLRSAYGEILAIQPPKLLRIKVNKTNKWLGTICVSISNSPIKDFVVHLIIPKINDQYW